MTTTLTNSTIATSLILLSLASSTSAQDAVQWRTEDGGNGHWYQQVPVSLGSFEELIEVAEVRGAQPVSVTSQGEHDLVASLVTSTTPETWSYLGARINTAAGCGPNSWFWLDGSSWSYTNWDGGQPDCAGSDAIVIGRPNGSELLWHDGPITNTAINVFAIIEWSADCNGDGIVDYGQILDGTLSDEDGNGVPDCCENGDCLNLVENGSFEQGPALNECSWHWIDVAGNNAIPGWTVTSESVARFRLDQDDTGCPERWRSFSGRHSLDLDGEGPGTIRTSIDTIPGEYYRLTFELTGNCDQAPNERGTAVTIGSTTRTFIHQCEFDGDEPWSTHAWMFRASDATTDIAFASLSNQGSRNGAVIDLVTVMSAGAPINVPAEYPTIQGAIDNAPAGAIIEVDPGTYGPFDLATDDLTIRSTGGAGVTRITTGLGGRGLLASGTSTNTTIQGFEFHQCQRAIELTTGSSLTILDCWFTENQAGGSGGAISMPGGSHLAGCDFRSNSSLGGSGGAVHILGGVTTVESCTFAMNTASNSNGGAIGLANGATLIVSDCRFEENAAGGAGAIDGRTGSRLEASRCLFIRNQATGLSGPTNGGASYLHESSGLIEDSLFLENTSAYWAGAIITYRQPVEIRRSYFIQNEASVGGNAFLVNTSVLTMTDSTICNSTGDWIIYQGGGSLNGAGNTITQTCASDDCNGDDIPDLIQIADGTFADCNGNSTPDTCELNDTLYASVDRTPDSPVDFIEFDVTTLGDAGDEVSLRIAALGELAATGEFMYVYLDDDLLGLAFSTDGLDCEEVVTDFIISPGDWNQAALDGTRLIRISGLGIDPDACAAPRTAIEVRVPLVVSDCDQNSIWDECEPDADADGTIDACDECPTDPLKTEAGTCGCGVEDTDTDADGTPDCFDDCPAWPGACSEDGQTLFVAIGEPIQAAIDVVPDSGVVELAAGTFPMADTLDTNGRPLTIQGAVDEDGTPLSILDGQDTRRVVQCISGEGDSTAFNDLIIRNGRFTYGAGMYIDASAPSINRCRFEMNTALNSGGGLYNENSSPVIRDCIFADNTAGSGAGIFDESGSLLMDGCTFESNTATGSGGGIHSMESSSEITGCTFRENTAAYGGAVTCILGTGTVTVDQSTFTRNIGTQTTGVQGGGAIHVGSFDDTLPGVLVVTNSDFTLNQSIWGAAVRVLAASADFADCSFENNGLASSGTGPGSLDGGAFHVRDGSVVNIQRCTATGNETEGRGAFLLAIYDSNVNITDSVITGNTALAGGGVTVGIDTEASTMEIGGSRLCDNALAQIDGTYTDLGGNCITETCDSDLDGTLDCIDGCPSDPEKVEPGDCGCGFPETDTDGDLIPDCVDPCPDWPYGCSEDGRTLVVLAGEPLDTALGLVPDGGTLELGPGTFQLTGSLDPGGAAITFQGSLAEDGSLATTIDALGNGSVLVFQSGEGPDTQVRDLILTGGSATYGGGIECSNGSSPSIIGCLIAGNVAFVGGGAINCYLDSSPLVENCILTGNAATLAGGGCAADQSTPRIVGCLIEGNDAPTGGGLYFFESGDARLEGTIVCGNTTDQVVGPYDDAGTNCIVDDCGNDLDQNGVPDACDPDCDGDGEPDAWEIESGQALDCNGNGVPDACDIETGVAIDCDTNGVPDACDIADGAEDDNANGELDVCELARGDFDLDGCIGGADLAILLSLWGLENPPIGDLDQGGTIGGADLTLLLSAWGGCD